MNINSVNFSSSTNITGIVSAKGDIISSTDGSGLTPLSVGADGTVLTANSGESTGLEWQTQATTSSGTYTPTITNLVGFTGSFSSTFGQFSQVGDLVRVSVFLQTISIPATPTLLRADISLPVARTSGNFSTFSEAMGTCELSQFSGPASVQGTSDGGLIFAVSGTETVQLQVRNINLDNTGNPSVSAVFSYDAS